MEAKPAEVPSEPLKYQTWYLKVSIHCEGCRRKVKKVLKNIDGVFTTTIDSQQQKVTVTGSVGVETLLRKLVRAGKHAEVWPENLGGKGKSSGNEEKKEKSGTREPKSLQNKRTENAAKCDSESKTSSSKTTGKPPEKPPASNQVPPEGGRSGGGGGGSGKKKKKRTQSGGNGLSEGAASRNAYEHSGFQLQNPGQVVGQVNLSPTRQQSFSYPETDYPPPMVYYVASHNRFFPKGKNGGSSYYVPPSPYMCAGIDQDGTCQFQSPPPLVSFEIFSDENANGCSIM